MSEALQQLIDREEIRDLMARYARGVDRADWQAVRETYHADAHDDHGDYKGGVDGFIEFAQTRTGGAPQCMHFLGQCLIEFAGPDAAIVETYFFTAHTLGPKAQKEYGTSGSGPVQLSSYGRYVDRMERRSGVWKIARRIVVFEANRTFTGEAPPLKPGWALGRRDKDDPIFRLRAEAGL
jgi:hypothetical protein